MINLLPIETKKQLKAAHMNSMLVKYVTFLAFSLVFLTAALYASDMILNNIKSSAESTIKINTTKSDSFASLSSQAKEINKNLSIAKTILSSQISYSDIVTGIGAAMPDNTVVEEISISNDTLLTDGLTIIIKSKDASSGDKAIANLKKSSLFSGVTSQSQKTNTSDASGYPISTTVQIKLNKSSTL